MRRMLAGVLLALAACQSAPPVADAASVCALPAPTIIERTGDSHGADGRLLQVWELDDSPVLWSEATPTTGGYPDFREKLATAATETDPVKLLQASPTANNDQVVANAGSWIKPAGCFEKLLVGIQHTRRDIFLAPTEFVSAVLQSADGKRLRIYFFTINQDGIGRMSPVTNPVNEDHAKGWRVAFVIHMHAFHPGNAQLNGVVSPSVPDADFNFNFAEEAGMKAAWITNGVSTVRIPAKEFGRFQRE
ncbi:MAG: hypothetical protein ABMA14_01270 [Hyphomonadaceae bacterium]